MFVVSVFLYLIHNLTIMVVKLYLIIFIIVIRLIHITLKYKNTKTVVRVVFFHGNYRIIYIR